MEHKHKLFCRPKYHQTFLYILVLTCLVFFGFFFLIIVLTCWVPSLNGTCAGRPWWAKMSDDSASGSAATERVLIKCCSFIGRQISTLMSLGGVVKMSFHSTNREIVLYRNFQESKFRKYSPWASHRLSRHLSCKLSPSAILEKTLSGERATRNFQTLQYFVISNLFLKGPKRRPNGFLS